MLSSSSSSRFEALPERPPTPPKEVARAVEDALSFLDGGNEIEIALKQPKATRTPTTDATPQSVQSSPERTASNGVKKVGFKHAPTYHAPVLPALFHSPVAQLRRGSPVVKAAKPLKSILKQSNQPPPVTPDDLETRLSYFSPQVPGSFANMLQSVIHQLAGPQVSGRLDAYLALNGALKAYEGVPDSQAMVSKMGLLMQFITRDMAWKNESTGALDTNIITQALKLTATMLFDTKLSTAMDDDFRTFLIDRSIVVIEQPDMPKALIKPHIFLLAQQRFRAPVVSSARADRILTALSTIEERCSGNSVVATKLVVYQRLLEQAPKLMLHRLRDWFENAMHGMLSDVKETRSRAIETCNQAGLILGEQPFASKYIVDLFNSEVEEGQSFCDYLTARLIRMISDRDTGAYVPQIWSAIVLFFRNRKLSLERWPKFRSWLVVIQKCLNSSNLTVRYHAHLAWNKIAYTIMPDASTLRNTLVMLKIPILAGINVRKTEPNAKQISRFALDSYYNILHYALRPGLSHEELDTAWDLLVEPVLADIIAKNDKGKWLACGVVHGICKANAGTWNLDAALESIPIKPEELPRLDPKWTRSRLEKILKLLAPVLELTTAKTMPFATPVDATWYHLMQSIADAGSQEIKISTELKEAIALLVSLWRNLWTLPIDGGAESDAQVFISRFGSLVSTSIHALGPGSFSEEIIAKTRDDGIQAALTPSHRSSKHHSAPQSPLVFLFGLLYHPPGHIQDRDLLLPLASQLLEMLVAARPSVAAQLELLAKAMSSWSSKHVLEADEKISPSLWACFAGLTAKLLEELPIGGESSESQVMGQTLRNASTILVKGVVHSSVCADIQQDISRLFAAIVQTARSSAGIGGVVVAAIEPFAKMVLDESERLPLSVQLALVHDLLRHASWPRSRQDIDQGRKALWGIGVAPQKAALLFDPFDQVYLLVTNVLTRIYTQMETLQGDAAGISLQAVDTALRFLEASPVSLLAIALRKTQAGFVLWVADVEKKTGSEVLADAVPSAWARLIQLVDRLPNKDSTLLAALEPLIGAGFSSPHREIVNSIVTFWNDSFGLQSDLSYPAYLFRVLRVRSKETHLSLPGFPNTGSDASIELPTFFQFQSELVAPSTRPSPNTGLVHHVSRIAATVPVLEATSSTNKKKTKQVTTRLRHDDSQVQFAPIESSPVRQNDDSQMLTEHQKEAKLRQAENAQMFPDMSSSPVAELRASRVQKKLDFMSSDAVREAGTPVRLADDGPMSDDIPSSPTPSSTRDADSAQICMADEDVLTEDEAAQDPPSSPPRSEQDAVVGADQDSQQADIIDSSPIVYEASGEHEYQTAEPELTADNLGSDLHSDTLLPNEQLELEAEQAANGYSAAADETTEGTTFYQGQQAVEDQSQSLREHDDRQSEARDDESISRVEESFVKPEAPEQSSSQASQTGRRKRKRVSDGSQSCKKRKSQSPLKSIQGFISSFLSNGKTDEEEDTGDEIVVASSQASASPEKLPKPPSPIVIVPARSIEEVEDWEPSQSLSVPQKRGRGRPRKSETPSEAPSQGETSQKRKLKRKSSALSEASVIEDAESSFIADTPAPTKARKKREGPDTKLVKAARLSQDQDVSRNSRRSVTDESHQSQAKHDAAGDEARQHTVEAPEAEATVPSQRSIATPKSIIGRLRDVLAELPKMLLGTQEERELDDVLFEIRREVHDAGRRGRV